ncbi:MAG: hypothetical protein JW888_01510 [Pirellulales bacterium]|nr:hypothetical protein [Pirellulales bacterium]
MSGQTKVLIIARPPIVGNRRAGTTVVLAAAVFFFLVAFLAFAIDVGYLCMARSQAQHCADAAALAAGLEMVSDARLTQNLATLTASAATKAHECAALQDITRTVVNDDPDITPEVIETVAIGRLDNPSNPAATLFPSGKPNAAFVKVTCDQSHGTPIPLFFARIFGIATTAVSAEATVAFDTDKTVGFKVEEDGPPCTLMPFVVEEESWDNLLANGGPDDWTYNPQTGAVTAGPDGIPELKMFPSVPNSGGVTPGNFGTVDIGGNDNSAAELERQIVEGPSAADLEPYGGELRLDSVTDDAGLPGVAVLDLNGDTGLTASMSLALPQVVGKPRTIMLYNDVAGTGDTTWFTICRFVGVRVVDFKTTGAFQNKYVLIQPAMVQDPTVITEDGDTSDFVTQPVHLVR